MVEDVLFAVGFTLVVAGLAWLSYPAAMVFAGVVFMVMSVLRALAARDSTQQGDT